LVGRRGPARLRIGNPFRIEDGALGFEEPELIEVAVTGAAGGVDAALGPDESGAGGAEGLAQGGRGVGFIGVHAAIAPTRPREVDDVVEHLTPGGVSGWWWS